MTYTVKYKKIGSIFWNKIENLKGDAILTDENRNMIPFRVFVTDKEERIEIPMEGMIFRFDQNRFLLNKITAERQVGHQIPVNSDVL